MTENTRTPARDRARRFGEELLGAELVAGKEATEAAGTLWDMLERGAKIQQQQFQWLLEDHAAYWRELIQAPSPRRWPGALGGLVSRRVEHIGAGFRATAELLDSEYTPLLKTWSSLLGALDQGEDRQRPSERREGSGS